VAGTGDRGPPPSGPADLGSHLNDDRQRVRAGLAGPLPNWASPRCSSAVGAPLTLTHCEHHGAGNHGGSCRDWSPWTHQGLCCGPV